MTTPITNAAPITTANYATAPADPSSSDAVSTLPPPMKDPLTTMLCSGDVGSAAAAMVMTTERQDHKAAKAARDAAYASMEASEHQEISDMDASANAKLWTGLLTGTAQAAGGMATIGAGASSDGGSKVCSGTADLTKSEGTIGGAIGKSVSDADDRAVERDKQSADTEKRVAEDHKDDMDDANKAIDKAMQFYQDWINSRNAEQAAALHRS